MPRLWCCSRRVCLYTCVASFLLVWATIALIAYGLLFHVALPARRQHFLEKAYLKALDYAGFSESLSHSLGWTERRRVQPLIQDVKQLHYWTLKPTSSNLMSAGFGGEWNGALDELLGIYFDGTGKETCRGDRERALEYWIYLGGTAANDDKKEAEDDTVFNHRYREHSCADPAYLCDMYNEAFDRVSQRWHGTTGSATPAGGNSNAILRFADCDISPWMCTSRLFGFSAGPVMLVHLKVGNDCDHSIERFGRCPVTWTHIGLPIAWRTPWTRQIKIKLDNGASTIVPAFPDVEEQLWSLMAHAGAIDALDYGELPSGRIWNSMHTKSPVEGDVHPDDLLGVNLWGYFNILWEIPWDFDFIPDEFLFKCYLNYYSDVFLKWWDGEPNQVYLYSCDQRMKDREAEIRMKQWWKDKQAKWDKESERWKGMMSDENDVGTE